MVTTWKTSRPDRGTSLFSRVQDVTRTENTTVQFIMEVKARDEQNDGGAYVVHAEPAL